MHSDLFAAARIQMASLPVKYKLKKKKIHGRRKMPCSLIDNSKPKFYGFLTCAFIN